MSILESPDPFLSQIFFFFFTQIQELLGDGAFGRVLKARDLQEDTDLGTRSRYPLVNCYIAMENHHSEWENSV